MIFSISIGEAQTWGPDKLKIKDVCEFVVMPEVIDGNTFFLDHIKTKNKSQVAYQSASVPQSRTTKFGSHIESLTSHCRNEPGFGKLYVWLNVFCVNQL